VFVETGFAGQFRQTIQNTLAVLTEAGAGPEHIVRMTWYVVDKAEYLSTLREIGAAWRELIGPHYPAMAVVEVKGLIEDAARVEIETTAVIPA
jgi:enamine deaminase RidA (YjgF/YER057c/UK114 family)